MNTDPFYTQFLARHGLRHCLAAGISPDPHIAVAISVQRAAGRNFVTSELHKNFSPLFQPALSDETKAFFRNRLLDKFKYVDGKLAGRDYLMGDFSVADDYLYVMLRWADATKLDLAPLKNLMAYKARITARPKVQEALKSEGLA